jgi:hypothetical protein
MQVVVVRSRQSRQSQRGKLCSVGRRIVLGSAFVEILVQVDTPKLLCLE